MSHKTFLTLRVVITLSMLAIAALILLFMYADYLRYPWTRDAQVQAQVIKIAPRISGPIVALPIHDNQFVKKGDLLWTIDPSTFKVAVATTEAELAKAQASEKEAADPAIRARELFNNDASAISKVKLAELENELEVAKAAVQTATANLAAAQLNLDYTNLYAPANGYITNLQIQVGTQAVANQAILALIDADTFWIQAFFKETLMKYVKPGNKVIVKLMSYPDTPLEGIVDSVGWGIAKKDGSAAPDLLPKIDPSFDWIRLAQRLPVRIQPSKLPDGVDLRVGTTATVIVFNQD